MGVTQKIKKLKKSVIESSRNGITEMTDFCTPVVSTTLNHQFCVTPILYQKPCFVQRMWLLVK